jgi:hypothetical protein
MIVKKTFFFVTVSTLAKSMPTRNIQHVISWIEAFSFQLLAVRLRPIF